MASAPAPSVASTKKTTNYARLCRLLVDVGSQALMDTFNRIHPPPGLHSVLAPGTPAHRILQPLRKKKILNPTQWTKLYPAVSSSVSSASFDITLLVVLLRNICNLTPPATGWDILPPPADMSTEANIARVKYYRNTVYGHATKASVDDVTFNILWKDIRKVLVALGGACYGAAIDKLLNESMDPDIEEYYKELLKEWTKYEDSIKEKLEKMEDTIRSDLQQMRSDLGNIDNKLDTLIEQREAQDEVRTKDQVKDLKDSLATLASRLLLVERKLLMEDVSGGIPQRHKFREGPPAPFPWSEEFLSDLDDVSTKLKGVNRTKARLGSSVKLQTLSLQDQKLDDASVIVLANSLKLNPTVTKLNLSGNNIGDAGAAVLADLLKSNKKLTKLKLSQNAIGDAGALQLAAGLKQGITPLTELDLADNNIGDIGATCLADALKSNKTLTAFNLSHNNIGDNGATSLANVLKQYNKVLEVLNLSSNNVGDAGAKSLVDALRENRNLSELNL